LISRRDLMDSEDVMGTGPESGKVNGPAVDSTAVGNGDGDSNLAKTFADLIDVMDIAMWQLDREYRVVGFNRKAKEIYGAQALGEFCYVVAAKRHSICRVCPAKMVYEGAPSGRSQHQRTNTQGHVIHIDHIATPIKNKRGDITGSLVLIIDISRYKHQEKELLEHRNNLEKRVRRRTQELDESRQKYRELYQQADRAEKIYRSLLNSSADAIVVYNLVGEVQYVSPSFSQIFGWPSEELVGKPIPFVPDSEKRATAREIQRLLETGEPTRNFPTKRMTKDGRLLDIYISASTYEDNEGRPTGILVILKDITETKALEMQLHRAQRIEALATLAGGIAHDFNNLMMGIMGNASLLLLDCDDHDPFRGKLENIEKCARRGGELTRQLLGLSKEGKYEVKPTDVNRLIDRCADIFGQTKKEIRIYRHLQEDVWTVDVDRGQIEQVLLNLFVNAGQAMPAGGDLHLTTRNLALDRQFVGPFDRLPGNYVEISITDTGEGISENIKDKIFDPFFTTKEKERGTGLGLASVYGIIRNHSGFIVVDSQVGRGSTFSAYLPASDKPVAGEPTRPREMLNGAETILLVDDEEIVIDVGRQLLKRLGYNVMAAGSGPAAVSIVEKHGRRIDLIILDMIMPGMSGGETFDRLKAIQPDILTLLSSGYSLNGQANAILRRGCNGFIQKPFNISDLSHKVRAVLDAAKGRPEAAKGAQR
jgi:PAS domain S-box-containing protein